jgi:hypothetical protein
MTTIGLVLDIVTPDIHREAARLETLGARQVTPAALGEHGSTWVQAGCGHSRRRSAVLGGQAGRRRRRLGYARRDRCQQPTRPGRWRTVKPAALPASAPVLYVLQPRWSYRLNADFEDHAEHEYALLVDEHPEWETEPYRGSFVDDFGRYDSLADLFRQISHDERLHKLESEAMMAAPRFS